MAALRNTQRFQNAEKLSVVLVLCICRSLQLLEYVLPSEQQQQPLPLDTGSFASPRVQRGPGTGVQ